MHRVPIPEEERPDSESFTPMHPDCLSGPEVQRKLAAVRERARAAAEAVTRLREESPGSVRSTVPFPRSQYSGVRLQ